MVRNMRKPLRRPPSDAKALARLQATLPKVLTARATLERDGHQPVGVVLPESMRPASWHDDAAVLGLPVTWGRQAGLIVPLD